MRTVSIAGGVGVTFVVTSLLLGTAGLADRPISIFSIAIVLLIAAAVGMVAARKIENRENRLELGRRSRNSA